MQTSNHVSTNRKKKKLKPSFPIQLFLSEIPSNLAYAVALLTSVRVEPGLYLNRDIFCAVFCDFLQFMYAIADIETLTASRIVLICSLSLH
jgi:hypothetical protein